ncbi:amino acid transporter [Amycolatopsis bartoniae]|uniref:Amino acid transporter n=1 Tax=Amycolatopsis bartoniae TaxID=941986 RepID=A0A8H9ITB5_9PSEU|nr:APC family permease [Amycolatopsis bartoniae]MBB2934290.1 amino acid transporter [Amycolatopsis bartoniae]TVT08488.1 APC family permease [Amycolatopsis bartoniae]GHF48448.1 amino acid transporter [Amycolatopsis bartoniae]
MSESELGRFGYEQELRRTMSLRDLVVYGMVFMVPIAPFSIFGSVFDGSSGMVPLTYVIGWIAMIFTAVSYREMSRAFPIAGSVYSYAGRGIVPSAGFLAGWAILLDYLLVPTLLYVVGAQAMSNVVPAVPQWLWIVLFVALNTLINLRGIETTATANKVFLYAQLLVLAVFVVLAIIGISRGSGGAHWSGTPFFNSAEFSPSLVFGALSIAVLSFLGFDAISTMSEEVRGGSRVIGRATLLALTLVAVLFIVQTYLAALLVPGKTQFESDDAANNAFYDISHLIGGRTFEIVVALAVAIGSAIANSLVAQAATSRLLFSMARDRQLPKFLRDIHPTRRVPQKAILLVAGISLVLGLFLVGQISLLSSLVNFGALFSFLLLHVSVVSHYLIRRRDRRYGLHLVVPLIGFVVIGYVLVNADIHAKVGGLVWLAIGVAVLVFFKVTGRSPELTLEEGAPAPGEKRSS